MKRLITTLLLASSLGAAPVMADQNGGNLLSRENLGGAIGATLGGFAGNKIVDGDGQGVATAAGAVGGWLLGQNIARNYGGNRQSYSRPVYRDTAPRYDSHGSRDTYYDSYEPDRCYDACLSRINATYVATTTSNVRAGPSTGYSITDRLYPRQQVQVIGKVDHRNWYMIRSNGRRGFVYAPLLRRAHYGYRDQSRHDDYAGGSYRRGRAGRGWRP